MGKASLVVEPYAYGEDPETPIGGGLASFDTEATVFQEDPTLAIDAAVTGSSDFRSLSVKRNADGSVASYESAVYATGGSAANYEVTFTRGNLTVEPESLADAARIIASADATAFTYNGSTQVPASFSVTDGGSELAENTDYTVSLPDSSTDAGDYMLSRSQARATIPARSRLPTPSPRHHSLSLRQAPARSTTALRPPRRTAPRCRASWEMRPRRSSAPEARSMQARPATAMGSYGMAPQRKATTRLPARAWARLPSPAGP